LFKGLDLGLAHGTLMNCRLPLTIFEDMVVHGFFDNDALELCSKGPIRRIVAADKTAIAD
jgi:hypothetical protein